MSGRADLDGWPIMLIYREKEATSLREGTEEVYVKLYMHPCPIRPTVLIHHENNCRLRMIDDLDDRLPSPSPTSGQPEPSGPRSSRRLTLGESRRSEIPAENSTRRHPKD